MSENVIKGNRELPGYARGVVLDQIAPPSHEKTYETNSFMFILLSYTWFRFLVSMWAVFTHPTPKHNSYHLKTP